MAERIGDMAAGGTAVTGHVLDHAEHAHIHFAEHGDGAAGIDEGEILRGGDDERAIGLELLRERELHVAGAGRQIDDQHVERAPITLLDHLDER